MASLENDGSDKQITGNNVHEEANIHEDEINLIDYFLVLWKYKWLVLLGSVLPALAVGLILFLSPKSYEVTYVYDVRDDVSGWNLNEINYNVFVSRFYSEENLNKITNKLCENDLNRYAKLINGGGGYLKEFVYFDIWPSYTDISKAKITELSQLKHIRQLNAQLLNVTIVARPRNDISKISSVIRDNLENVIPVYVVEEHLNADIMGFKARIADIDENRFAIELALKANESILAKLKNIRTPVSDKSVSSISLQFDISGKTEYLPLDYQIQAAETKRVKLEESIKANEEIQIL